MVYGTIIRKGEQAYTFLKKLFESIDNIQLNYKWLISYPECNTFDEIQKIFDKEYCILTGKELTDLVNKEDFQWEWGTFSAFDPSTSDEDILKYKLPRNDMYPGFWKNPLTIQHPLAKMEIVAFDSSLTLIFTKDFALPESFKEFYPLAEDLELLNRSLQDTKVKDGGVTTMENENNACYEVKLNRLLNIQTKQNLLWLAVLIAWPIVLIVVGYVNGTMDLTKVILLYCLSLTVMIIKLLSSPKCLDVTPDTIHFTVKSQRGGLLQLLTMGQIRRSSFSVSGYEKDYTLYNIKSIEYLQTPFEKRFSCGHICICGDVNVSETEKEQRSFVIYGVKDFENTSAWMKEFVKLAVDA